MGKQLTLVASDNNKLSAYRADPTGKPKGGIVVIQEIFGVNGHIRNVCDKIAAEGYAAVAPALFDRQQPNYESGYTQADIDKSLGFLKNPDFGAFLKDTQAAIDELKGTGPVGIIGFCLGGTIAFVAAADLNGLSASVGYYGGFIAKFADKKPKVPTLLIFGDKDHSIPMSDVEAIKKKRPELEYKVYEGAAHGFNCDERGSYHKESADDAWKRSIAFFAKNLK